MRSLFRATALGAMIVLALSTVASATRSDSYVHFGHAKRQLKRYAAMVCPNGKGACPWRVYACQRRSAQRVDCRSETLINNEEIPVEHENEAIPNEICSWLGIATPFRGSATNLRLRAKHFTCHYTESRSLPPR